MAEFFDVGESRTVAWARRPQSAAIRLLLVDDGTTVRAAVGQTSGLKSGAVASSKGAGIDAVLEVGPDRGSLAS
jgi:hypothetical protein